MSRVYRTDAVEAKKTGRTPSGAIRVDGVLASGSVLTYRLDDGSERREYRPPDESGRPETLASIDGAPLTLGHPADLVTPETYRRDARGHVSAPRMDGANIVATVLVSDVEAIAAVDGDIRGLSLGYVARLDETPGVTEAGEEYDAVQRDVVVNHVAIVSHPRSEGASIRLDSRLEIMGAEPEKKDQRMTEEKAPSVPDTSALRVEAKAMAALFVRADSLGVDIEGAETVEDMERAIASKMAPELRLDDESADFVRGVIAAASIERAPEPAPETEDSDSPAPQRNAEVLRVDYAEPVEHGPAPWDLEAMAQLRRNIEGAE